MRIEDLITGFSENQPLPASNQQENVEKEDAVCTYPVIKMYDSTDQLLYVSRTVQFQSLAKRSWLYTVARMEVDWYRTPGQAEDAKLVSIENEKPLWNKFKTR